MKKIGLFIIGCISMFMLNSCDPNSPTPSTPTTAKVMNNLSYGAHARNKMDVRLAKDRTPSDPFVIIIHGGAWTSGDKTELNMIADSLSNKGISSASINYRYASMGDDIHYEELMEDVHAALDMIVDSSAAWDIRASNYGLFGHSAGAHMALLYAYKYDTDDRISAVVSAAGPTDIADVDFLNYSSIIGLLPQITAMVGAEYTLGAPVPEQFSLCSPARYPGNTPTLLIHGSADLVVAEEHSNRLKRILDDRGTENAIIIISGANHDLGIGDKATKDRILDNMEEWYKAYR